MLKYLYILPLLLLLVACSSDDYVGEVLPTERPITLGGNGGMVTRAGSVGLETYLPDDNKTVLLYGIKNTAPSNPAHWQDVFQNYVLTWGANTAGTSLSNSSGWEYVGGTSVGPYDSEHGTTTPTTQTIKYWDYGASPYNFFAVAPVDRANPIKGTTPDEFEYTVDVDPANPSFFTRVQSVEKAQYGETVALQFQSLLSKVRVGLYETIPGYEITGLTFYTSLEESSSSKPRTRADESGQSDQPVLIGVSDDEFATSGTYTIRQNVGNTEMDVNLNPSGNGNTLTIASRDTDPFISNPTIDIPGNTPVDNPVAGSAVVQRCQSVILGNGDEKPVLGRASNDATMGFTPDGRGYVSVLSDPNKSHQLSIKCDYTLQSKSSGSNDVITIKGRTATVPVQYGTWRPNYAYTYLFKITDDGSGLYPLSFDACVETFADNDDGVVIIVQKPSITTWQYQAVHQGDVNNNPSGDSSDKDVQYVVAINRADDTHDIDVEVSATDIEHAGSTVQGIALEACYYGPQITEGEFEYLDKQARNDVLPDDDPNHIKPFVWAPIASGYGTELTPQEYGYRRSTTELRNTTALMNSIERADSHLPEGVTTPHTTDAKYNDGTFKFGTFRPLLGGYYAIRFTYKVTNDGKETQLYAYKIVKIGEYSFLEPTIQIDDNYQHGILIE